MTTWCFDIESVGLLDHNWIDYSKLPYKLKPEYKIHCLVAIDIELGTQHKFVGEDIYKFRDLIKDGDVIVGHNIIGFDLPCYWLYTETKYEINPNIHERVSIKDGLYTHPDLFNGKKVAIVDTLILSKLVNADRPGGHSLKNWGKKLKNAKINYGVEDENAWAEFDEEMLDYCVQDVFLNIDVYKHLQKEMQNPRIWEEAYQLEAAIADIVFVSSQYGFKFNRELAEWCVKDLDSKMKEIEDKVHPLLPERVLPQGQQPNFPKNPFKKPFNYDKTHKKAGGIVKAVQDYLKTIGWTEEEFTSRCFEVRVDEDTGERELINKVEGVLPKHSSLLSSHALGYCEKIGVTDIDRCLVEVQRVLDGGEVKLLKEPMTLDNQNDLKQYIISMGWKPTVFNENDILTDNKKKRKTSEKVRESVERYVKETLSSKYCEFRCEHLGCKPENLKKHLLKLCQEKNRVIVRTTPKYTVDNDKNICPNLIKLGDKVDFIKDVVLWMTYRHRRNNILSPNGTGWLAHPRLDVDGRIPTPADTLATASGRFRHSVVVNVPRASSLYGGYMRGLFGVEDYQYLMGSDAAGLEARTQAHWVYPQKGGEEYVNELMTGDVHQINADNAGITRDEAKTLLYACLPVNNTFVLTDKGWRTYSELSVGDKVLSYNTNKCVIEMDDVKNIYRYEGATTCNINHNYWAFESTLNHRWYVSRRTGRGGTRRYIEEFRTTENLNTECNIINTSNYIGGESTITADEAAIIGWVISDGHVKWAEYSTRTSSSFGKKRGVITRISQSERKYAGEIRELLQRNCKFNEYVYKDTDIITFDIKPEYFRSLWVKCGFSFGKNHHEVDYHEFIINLSREARESFIDACYKAEGHICNRTKIIGQNKGNIQEGMLLAAYLCGYNTTMNLKEITPSGKEHMTIRLGLRPHTTCQKMDRTLHENRDVFCIQTNNGTFIARQGNTITITGNSMYGAQPPKIAQQMNWPLNKAKKVFEDFWKGASPLKSLVDGLSKEWEIENGKKFLKGLDGRRLITRFLHALLNNQLQSSGIQIMKRQHVLFIRRLSDEKLLGNPFIHTKDELAGKVCMNIAYHDEIEVSLGKDLVRFKKFEDEEKALQFQKENDKYLFGDVIGNERGVWLPWSRVGEICSKAFNDAGKYYNLNVPIDGDYMIGKSWKDVH